MVASVIGPMTKLVCGRSVSSVLSAPIRYLTSMSFSSEAVSSPSGVA